MTMSHKLNPDGETAPKSRVPFGWQFAAWLVALAVTLPVEIGRIREFTDVAGPLGWLFGWYIDTTLPFLLLLCAPLVWRARRRIQDGRNTQRAELKRWFGPATKPGGSGSCRSGWREWTLALLVFSVSIGASANVAAMRISNRSPAAFAELPPGFHDEYSYLLMAKTFLAGRTWVPSHPTMPELFDQMHVLNEGRVASRYFPGTGAWMAPFVAVGEPCWGHWLAGGLCAVFVFWAGRELAGNAVGFLAGLLTAVAPGMAIFSNLLLAHHPTLTGLSLFLYAFLRLMRTARLTDGLLAGAGLSFAMLCRPLTAAGFGLPFGLWLFWWLVRGTDGMGSRGFGFRLRRVAAVGAPVLAGFLILFAYNQSITGSGWPSPYQLYGDIYTPRHAYGFNNAIRGEQRAGAKVIEDYDRWAENLTPALAARNVWHRLLASCHWTLGFIPLVMAAVVFPGFARGADPRWWLVAASILALHAVHVPYWYEGAMGYHYVFETGPLWLLLFAGVTQGLLRDWRERGREGMRLWWGGMIVAALLPQYLVIESFWPKSRVQAELPNLSFSRWKHAAVQQALEEFVSERPALVLISGSLREVHIDYVMNDPGLTGEVIRGRLRPGETDLGRVIREFPNRRCYLVVPASDSLEWARRRDPELRFASLGEFTVPPKTVCRVIRVRPADSAAAPASR